MTKTTPLLLVLAFALCAGCLAPIQYTPRDDLVASQGVEATIEELHALVMKSVKPSIDYNSVKITEAGMSYALVGIGRDEVSDSWGAVGSVRLIAVGGAARYDDPQATRDVQILDNQGREIRTWRFLGEDKAKRFADLVMSMRRGK